MNLTDASPDARRGRLARPLARAALALGLLCAAVALLAGPAYRLGLLPLSGGLMAMRCAAWGALGGAVLALLAGGLGIGAAARGAWGWVAAALLLNAAVAMPPFLMYRTVQTVPRIHDISTDTADPPAYVAALPLRQGARNGTDYSAETAALQRKGYPDIAPLQLDLTPAQAFARAEQAVRTLGWAVVAVAPNDLRIEATDTTLLFGFKDDIVIRIRPQGAGSRVDMRSLSRVGGSDFGVNAKRVRRFLQEMAH